MLVHKRIGKRKQASKQASKQAKASKRKEWFEILIWNDDITDWKLARCFGRTTPGGCKEAMGLPFQMAAVTVTLFPHFHHLLVQFTFLKNESQFLVSLIRRLPLFLQPSPTGSEPKSGSTTANSSLDEKDSKLDLRVLYIVTSLSEFDTGERSTTTGDDRFFNTVLPVVVETTHSLTEHFAHVNVYLIAGYTLNATRWQTFP